MQEAGFRGGEDDLGRLVGGGLVDWFGGDQEPEQGRAMRILRISAGSVPAGSSPRSMARVMTGDARQKMRPAAGKGIVMYTETAEPVGGLRRRSAGAVAGEQGDEHAGVGAAQPVAGSQPGTAL